MMKYEVGQVWHYDTRAGEEGSRVFIVRVDDHPDEGTVFHIYVDQLKIRNPRLPGGFQDYLPHSPVSVESLNQSVMELAEEQVAELPDISEAYESWRQSRGGVFTIPIKQIVQLIENIAS